MINQQYLVGLCHHLDILIWYKVSPILSPIISILKVLWKDLVLLVQNANEDVIRQCNLFIK